MQCRGSFFCACIASGLRPVQGMGDIIEAVCVVARIHGGRIIKGFKSESVSRKGILMRKPFIVGNWKMNLGLDTAIDLAEDLKKTIGGYDKVDIGVCPVFCCIPAVVGVLSGSEIMVGGQNIHQESSGAYTGEVSAPILASTGTRLVIVGHSERRQYFGETNEDVKAKVRAGLEAGLLPIVCVGEQLEQREQGLTEDVVRDHIHGGLDGLSPEEMLRITVAYEPVWAIGTGKTATPQQAQEVHSFIRNMLAGMFGNDVAQQIRLQYGGSVKQDNVKGLMEQPDIDGALVGGASLKADSFTDIVRFGD